MTGSNTRDGRALRNRRLQSNDEKQRVASRRKDEKTDIKQSGGEVREEVGFIERENKEEKEEQSLAMTVDGGRLVGLF